MQFHGSVMSPVEAEIAVRQIKSFAADQVGTEAWKEQREALEKLNMCTHSNAVQKTDDYVSAFLVEHEKLVDVLHELLVMEVWRQRLLPRIMDDIEKNPAAAYLYCAYESILVNFFECLCFQEEVVKGLGDEILELIDYCWRQVSRLFAEPNLNDIVDERAAAANSDAAPNASERLERQLREQRVQRGLQSLSILWFIVDRLDDLPMAAMNAVLLKHDLPVGLAEVLQRQPWIRRSATGSQKFQNGTFVAVSGDEIARVCVPEAHVWFSIHKLLCDAECRRRYLYTQHKKAVLLQMRRFLSETLVDQIPALQDVQRALEELSFMEPPSGTEEKFKSRLIIEQVPRLMVSIDAPSRDWESEASRMRCLLTDRAEAAKDAMRLSGLFDLMFSEVR